MWCFNHRFSKEVIVDGEFGWEKVKFCRKCEKRVVVDSAWKQAIRPIIELLRG